MGCRPDPCFDALSMVGRQWHGRVRKMTISFIFRQPCRLNIPSFMIWCFEEACARDPRIFGRCAGRSFRRSDICVAAIRSGAPAALALCATLILPLGGCIARQMPSPNAVIRNAPVPSRPHHAMPTESNQCRQQPPTRPISRPISRACARKPSGGGVSRATFDPRLCRSHSTRSGSDSPDPAASREFARPIWDYLDGAVSATRIRLGNEGALRATGRTLAAVERAYGVPQAIVLGIWGMETNFGGYKGSKDVFRSLATPGASGPSGRFLPGRVAGGARNASNRGKISP